MKQNTELLHRLDMGDFYGKMGFMLRITKSRDLRTAILRIFLVGLFLILGLLVFTGSNVVAQEAKTYTVKAGDTLSLIARQFGVAYTGITGYRSGNPNLIYPGEVLTIPNQTQTQTNIQTPPHTGGYNAGAGVEQWRWLVAQYFPADQVNYALAIMRCESGGNPNAHSPTADRGLMQINQVHSAKVGGNLNSLFDPHTNMRVARQVWDGAGWGAWTCSWKI